MPCGCERAIAAARAEEEAEWAEQRRVRFRVLWSRSGVPERYAHVAADGSHYETLAAGRALYVHGPNGRGKTYLACQVAKHYAVRSLYRAGGLWHQRSVRFAAVQDVFTTLRSSWDRWDVTEEDVFSRFAGVDLLVLDDLGKGKPTEWGFEALFNLVNDRYANAKPTIFTSQYSPADLARRYAQADRETVSALQSRLLGWCEPVLLDGPDRRLANG